jgi:hypothetical protein
MPERRTTPAKPTVRKTEPVPTAPPPAPEPRFTRELRHAERQFRLGHFAEAREQLEGLRSRITAEGAADEQAEYWRLLTFVYVAFDLEEDACTAYGSLRRIAADAPLDPDLVSPKIRRVVNGCRAG